jgi:hypothetical protein
MPSEKALVRGDRFVNKRLSWVGHNRNIAVREQKWPVCYVDGCIQVGTQN